jgi:hypothetical protein
MKTLLITTMAILAMLFASIGQLKAQVQVISPNGGENWLNGEPVTIVWNNSGEYGYFVIEYSGDNGNTWSYLTSFIEGLPGTNEVTWQLYLTPTEQALIRISEYQNESVFDISDAVFTVSSPPYFINSPYPGQVYYSVDIMYIYWTTYNSDPVNIDFSNNYGQTWTQIASGVVNGYYTWDIPDLTSTECLIKLSSSVDPTFFSISGAFTIKTPPEVTVLSPNGGEVWNYVSGEVNTISWSGENLSSYIAIELSTDGGQSWMYLAYDSSSPTGGSYSLPTPIYPTDNARIKIYDPSYYTAADISDADFTINVPPYIIYSPAAESRYFTGEPIWVSWYAFPTSDVNVEISTDNGLTFETVGTSIPALQASYTFNAPPTASESCIVKLVEANNPASFTLSSTFRIIEAPVLSLIQPNGGEIYDNDSLYTIKWTYTGEVLEYFYLVFDLSMDNGMTWTQEGFEYATGNQGTIQWRTPVETSDSCLIRLSDYFYPFITISSSSVFSIKEFPDLEICMVSVDQASGKNMIVWNNVQSDLIEEYVIMKETNIANDYIEIASLPFDGETTFIDLESNPREKATRYKLTFRDQDENLYSTNSLHQTIHLTISQGVGNSWNLSWNQYLGFPVNSYNVYRGTTPENMEMLGTVSGNFTSYTDLNAPSGYIYYMIEVINPNECNPTGEKSGKYGSSMSNVATNNLLGIFDKSLPSALSAYPNPAKDKIKIRFQESQKGEITASFVSATGSIIKSEVLNSNSVSNEIELEISDLDPGIYTILLSGDKVIGTARIIKLN